MAAEQSKLDNPVWHSLSEVHQEFSISYEGVKFYQPGYCPFGGFVSPESVSRGIAAYARLTQNFYVVGELPAFDHSVVLNKELVCNQMLLERPLSAVTDENIIELQAAQQSELFNLVNLVQPGYFKSKTSELGKYYGIFQDDQLVAVTGERMKMNAYTEISAVVTHPEYTGKGLAKKLLAHTANRIFAQKKIPYLHVAETNTGAIALYEKLGFVTRRKISF